MDDALESIEFSEPMPCYEFNGILAPNADDGRCVHCRKFLTIECPYIDHFMEDRKSVV